MDYFATFAVVFENDKVWCTTREDGTIGLPGGKVDPNETSMRACIRECSEEGLLINDAIGKIVKTDVVSDKPVVWYQFESATALTEYKEKYRGIKAVLVSIEDLIASNPYFKNDFLLELYESKS